MVCDQIVATAASRAKHAFALHQVTEVGPGRWKCAAPDTWIHGFYIVTWPGTLIVTGDIGFLAVQRTENMLAWARGAVDSLGYFDEKVPHCIQTEEYNADLAREQAAEMLADLDEFDDERRQQWQEAFGEGAYIDWTDEQAVVEAFYEFVGDCEYPRPYVFNQNFLWCVMALKWFLNWHERQPDDEEQGCEPASNNST